MGCAHLQVYCLTASDDTSVLDSHDNIIQPFRLPETQSNAGKTSDFETAQPPAQPRFVPDSDLSLIVENWNSLEPPIKLAIMALVRTTLEREVK